MARYFAHLLVEMLKAGLVVMRLIYVRPKSIQPKLVWFRTPLETDRYKALLSDSITLTAGTITVLAEGEKVFEQQLPDDPADCNGVLSWHYQTRDRYLDEAGSYGYLMIVPIGGEALKEAKEKGKLRVELKCDAGGLAIYGRNAGRFPMDIEILPKL